MSLAKASSISSCNKNSPVLVSTTNSISPYFSTRLSSLFLVTCSPSLLVSTTLTSSSGIPSSPVSVPDGIPTSLFSVCLPVSSVGLLASAVSIGFTTSSLFAMDSSIFSSRSSSISTSPERTSKKFIR